jgi:hypothetical protein
MKVLLFLNGAEGWQTGIEDGFNSLLESKEISDLQWFYYQAYAEKNGTENSLKQIRERAIEFQPQFIAFFHISNFSLTKEDILFLKSLNSRPIISYDEGDMYGTWAKPLTRPMKNVLPYVDAVSVRGVGLFAKLIEKYNRKIIYTPHHSDIARFDTEPYLLREKKNDLVLIGNRIKPRYLSALRRMPGSLGREEFVKCLGNKYPSQFKLYGKGWEGFCGNQGEVHFQKQIDVYRDSWITVAYEHYPEVSYYFSNRLPIALMAGSMYVCHYHKGYEDIFKETDFIFFFKSNDEIDDIIKFIFSLSKEELYERSVRAREFALKRYHPKVIWRNFYYNSIKVSAK